VRENYIFFNEEDTISVFFLFFREINSFFNGNIKFFLKGENEMNEEGTRNLLKEEIETKFLRLLHLESGSKEEKGAIDDLIVLYRLKIDEDKVKLEDQFKKDQLSEQKKDRYFRTAIEAVGIVSSLIFYAVWMTRGFRFEETGSYTSATFKGFWSHFRPTRR